MSVFFSLSLGLLIASICVIYIRWKASYKKWKVLKLIPGPKNLPIVGNLFDLGKPEIAYGQLLTFSKVYPIFKLNWFYLKVSAFVYSPETAELILTDMKQIDKGDAYDLLHHWLGGGLLTSTGAKWQKMRKTLTPAFHFSILNEFLEIFNRESEHLVKVIKQQPSQIVDVVAPITEYTLSSIGETSLGVQISQEPNSNEYKQAVYDFGEVVATKLAEPWLRIPLVQNIFPIIRKDKTIVAILHDFSTTIIQKRKKQLEDNADVTYSTRKKLALLDLLLRAQKQGGANIKDKDIREEIDTFMFEGHDTTAISLCFTLLALANEPQIQEELYQEIMDIMGDKKAPDASDLTNMTFMERCVKESLRLYPSVPIIGRNAGEDIKTKEGYIIPKGTEVNVLIHALHLSPALWDDPEKFDPDRFLPENIASRHPFAYVPFSAGPRNCIGQKYALLEIKAALCHILTNFRLEAVDKPRDMKFKLDLVLRTNCPIRVKFLPRN